MGRAGPAVAPPGSSRPAAGAPWRLLALRGAVTPALRGAVVSPEAEPGRTAAPGKGRCPGNAGLPGAGDRRETPALPVLLPRGLQTARLSPPAAWRGTRRPQLGGGAGCVDPFGPPAWKGPGPGLPSSSLCPETPTALTLAPTTTTTPSSSWAPAVQLRPASSRKASWRARPGLGPPRHTWGDLFNVTFRLALWFFCVCLVSPPN